MLWAVRPRNNGTISGVATDFLSPKRPDQLWNPFKLLCSKYLVSSLGVKPTNILPSLRISGVISPVVHTLSQNAHRTL